jgi:anti-sigma factor (TIGR02949 family)
MTNNSHDHKNGDEIGCLDAIESLYAWLDGELDEQSASQLEQHISHCRSCYSRRQMELELTARMKKSTKSRAPDVLRDRLRKLIDEF